MRNLKIQWLSSWSITVKQKFLKHNHKHLPGTKVKIPRTPNIVGFLCQPRRSYYDAVDLTSSPQLIYSVLCLRRYSLQKTNKRGEGKRGAMGENLNEQWKGESKRSWCRGAEAMDMRKPSIFNQGIQACLEALNLNLELSASDQHKLLQRFF
jgi:hypothetical protein